MDTPYIYVACLSSYNNGMLFGRWIDATQSEDAIYEDIHNMLAESPMDGAEEWALHDFSGFGEARLSEYESIENVVKIAAFIAEHGALGSALLDDYSIEEAATLLEEHYHGVYDDEVDFARTIFDDCYRDAIPEHLISYWDYEAFARDLFLSDYFSVEVLGKTHIFCSY